MTSITIHSLFVNALNKLSHTYVHIIYCYLCRYTIRTIIIHRISQCVHVLTYYDSLGNINHPLKPVLKCTLIMYSTTINVHVLSNNVRGLNDPNNRFKYSYWLRENNIDIFCIQETFCTQTNVNNFERDWKGVYLHALSDSSHSRGVSILIERLYK